MGRKTNPIAIRLGFNRDWESHWFSDDKKKFTQYLYEDFIVRKKILNQLKNAGIAKVEIYRNRANILIEIYTSRPGIVIGRGGEGTKKIINLVKKDLPKGKLDLIIKEVADIYQWPQLIASQIAYRIERRIPHRRVMHQAISEAMTARKIKGIKIRVSGRLGGQEIARSELLSEGSVPSSTFKADVDFAFIEAYTKYGKIGIKVWVNRGEKRKFKVKIRKKAEF